MRKLSLAALCVVAAAALVFDLRIPSAYATVVSGGGNGAVHSDGTSNVTITAPGFLGDAGRATATVQGAQQSLSAWITGSAIPSTWFPFSYRQPKPGCYSTGSTFGITNSETLTVTRATTADYFDSSTLTTCTNNQLPVTPNGAFVAGAATQFYPVPSDPTYAGTVNLAGTGRYAFSVVGTGSKSIAAGTVTATGLPCTASAGSPCYLNVTVGGTVSFGAPSGSLTWVQLENSALPTGPVTSGTRNATVVSGASIVTSSPRVCLQATVTAPDGGWRPFATDPNVHFLAHYTSGAYGAANSVELKFYNSLLYFQVWDATPTQRYVSPSFSLAGSTLRGPLWTGTHTLTGCADGIGGLFAYADGCYLPIAPAGTGTGKIAATGVSQSLYIGGRGDSDASSFLGAAIQDVQVLPTFRGRDPLYDVLSVGDSITQGTTGGSVGFPEGLAYLRGPCHAALNYGWYGGTIAQIQTAYQSAIGKASYDSITVEGGVNDIRAGTSAAATWATYKAIVDDALGRGMSVYALTVMPCGGFASCAGKDSIIQAMNASIAGYAPPAASRYHVVDTYTLLTDGSGNLASAYDSGDHLHPNQAGNDAIATAIKGAWVGP